MQSTINKLMQSEVPNLANMIEASAARTIKTNSDLRSHVPANVESLLQDLPFFHDLSYEELHAVASIGNFHSVRAGETIFKQGDPGDALYVLITGGVQIFLLGEKNERIELARLTDGAYFGDLALIDGQQRSAGAVAMEDCEFFLVGRTEFLRLMTESPRILADVLIGLSEHIRNSNQRHVEEREDLIAESSEHG